MTAPRRKGSTAENPVARIFAENPVLLAPMSGITDAPFRVICKRMGAGLTYTEMVSAKGLHYNPDSPSAGLLLAIHPDEAPCAVQIFGSDPGLMADQAARIVTKLGDDVALIDINMGCPVTKVVAKGEGSALMRTVELASDIVRAVVSAVDVPVTVKFRKGWSQKEVNAVDFAIAMEQAGASSVTVHGRTREQFYRGHAEWDVIAAVKQAVNIPVAGSGDIFTPTDVLSMLKETGVDAVMVARGARGNPWIFSRTRELLRSGSEPTGPAARERIDVAVTHAEMMRVFAGERGFVKMRKHVAWYVAGLPGATVVRTKVNGCRSHVELVELLRDYRTYLEGA